jgi:hypothetical protein
MQTVSHKIDEPERTNNNQEEECIS